MIPSFIWSRWAPRIPRLELLRFKKINLFPPRPAPGYFDGLDTICIGSKSRTIGDALMLSGLPAKLKARYPRLKIYTYPRGFNPVVFAGNPHVSGVQYLPDAIYGDDCNWGEGHLIQLKERYFELPISEVPRPEIHLLPHECREIEKEIARYYRTENQGKPLCVIHPWGHTHTNVLTRETWEKIVREWSPHFRFWQVGIEGHTPIEGCEHHFLTPKTFHHARRLFALMSHADVFIGVDSGPMHAAQAFGVRSLVIANYKMDPQELFRLRRENPYFLRTKPLYGFLYENNAHIEASRVDAPTLIAGVRAFLESRSQ